MCCILITFLIPRHQNFRASAEFNEDDRLVFMEAKLQWQWHREHLPSIIDQTDQTWGQRRHMTNADLFAPKHTYTPTGPLPFPTGSLLSIHLFSQPCDQEKTSFHFLEVSRGSASRSFTPGQTWAGAHQLPDQRAEWAQGSSLTEAIIKTEVMF